MKGKICGFILCYCMEPAEIVMKLVADLLAERPLRAEHMTFGHNSITYDVELPTRNVIVRTNTNADVFAGTEHNLRVLAGLGLPVPSVLASDRTQTDAPFTYMILPKLPGRDLGYELAAMTREQMTRLAGQIVSFQRRVATLPQGTGYGYVPIGAVGPHASWWDVIADEWEKGRRRANEGHVSWLEWIRAMERMERATVTEQNSDPVDRLEARAIQKMMRYESYFRQTPATCFLDDVTVKNVIMQDGELQGLVDFDCVCYGDPLYWMALTAAGVLSDVGTAELFYVEELARLWELTDLQREILTLYSAWHGLWFVRTFAAGETSAWNERMLTGIARWLQTPRHGFDSSFDSGFNSGFVRTNAGGDRLPDQTTL